MIERHLRWIFPLPSVLFIMAMMAFPVLFTIGVSLTDWSMTSGADPRFIGLNNYRDLLQDSRFYNAVWLTLYFTVLAVGVETVLGVGMALILNREFTGKSLVKGLLLLPMVATPVAIGLAWTLFYEPSIGLANYALTSLGLPASRWLASPSSVIPALAIVDIWQWTPMIALIVMAGLASLPHDPFEAAMVDGATPLQVFRFVTLPMLMPTILVAVILRGIDAFKTFDIILTMTAGGPGFASETLNIYAYNLGFGYFRFGMASTALVALLAVVLGGSLLVLWLRNRFDY
ncbi:MAG: sugar ABC transporter permease [Sporomusaceae bacterium]|nr:sugar ABC transporter permease [Sporomusaceae bacterium]